MRPILLPALQGQLQQPVLLAGKRIVIGQRQPALMIGFQSRPLARLAGHNTPANHRLGQIACRCASDIVRRAACQMRLCKHSAVFFSPFNAAQQVTRPASQLAGLLAVQIVWPGPRIWPILPLARYPFAGTEIRFRRLKATMNPVYKIVPD